MEPPAGVADLGTDVASVRRAEALPVMVPTERVLHRSTETRHMEAVLVLLILYPAAGGEVAILNDPSLPPNSVFQVSLLLSSCFLIWIWWLQQI